VFEDDSTRDAGMNASGIAPDANTNNPDMTSPNGKNFGLLLKPKDFSIVKLAIFSDNLLIYVCSLIAFFNINTKDAIKNKITSICSIFFQS
jgi:hypothetical protein